MSIEENKMLVDYSVEAAEKIEAAEKMADGDHMQAIDSLMILEKNCRVNQDANSLGKVLVCIVNICYKKRAWNDLNDQIVALTKRRSLIKLAITKMVQRCCEFVEEMEKEASLQEAKMELIDCLRNQTDGKIYVEVERARLTLKLALLMDSKQDTTGAAKTINELQVETYGSMDRQEKVSFILEQMRMTIADEDFVRAQIISKKISTRYFSGSEAEKEEVQILKIKYYKLMIELSMGDKKNLDVARHFIHLTETKIIQNENQKCMEALASAAIFCILSDIGPEQQSLLNTIFQMKTIKTINELAPYKQLIKKFLTPEIMKWSKIKEDFTKELRSSSIIAIFDESPSGESRWSDLHNRSIEHNIRVISKAFTRIRTQRMAEHLDLTIEQTEKHLSDMVVKGAVWARIDRLSGITNFESKKLPSERLNEWSNTVETLMDLINKACHCIQKEEMIHALKA